MSAKNDASAPDYGDMPGGLDARFATLTIEFEPDQLEAIRGALLIGLASYGEIDRILNYVDTMKAMGQKIPESLTPIHPTGSADTIGMFANALRMVNR